MTSVKQLQRCAAALIFVAIIAAACQNVDTPAEEFEYIQAVQAVEAAHPLPIVAAIPWVFRTYSEPSFMAESIATFSPQNVTIAYYPDDGWALLNTYYGEVWVYLNEHRRFLERTMGLYEYIGAELPVGFIAPQIVTVLSYDGDWLEISAPNGYMWVYLNFTPPTNELDELLRRFGNTVSVYFENIETGFVYLYNPERTYMSASILKAPLALYILELAEQGCTGLDNVYTYISEDYQDGAGLIRRRFSYGANFNLHELLRLNVSYSDNIATNMLMRIYGLHGFRQFVADLGANPLLVAHHIYTNHFTVNDAAIFARAIFDYIESDTMYSHYLKAFLLDNQFPFIVSDYPVASKTGFTLPRFWHDMAIVYAPSPYILIILSDRYEWYTRPTRTRDFGEISQTFQNFNSKWFTP